MHGSVLICCILMLVARRRQAPFTCVEATSGWAALMQQISLDPQFRPAARADLLKKLGRFEEAAEAYRRALSLVANEPERRFLERRLAEVEDGAT